MSRAARIEHVRTLIFKRNCQDGALRYIVRLLLRIDLDQLRKDPR